MQYKIISRRIILMFIIAGSALSLASLFHFISKSPTQNDLTLPVKEVVILPEKEKENMRVSHTQEVGRPVRLTIPAINVDSLLEYINITSKGEVGIPKGPTDAAWFDAGPRPGDNGSAVITGHYGWKDGIPAVFDNLSRLKKGDKLFVEDENGTTTTFVVRESRRYDQNTNPLDVFTSSDKKAHLNLITCEGIWNKAEQSYSKRLVVFTDKE